MKSIVIGDLHNNVEEVEGIVSRYPEHKIIFVGDYFDNFGDCSIDATCTADWLKYSLKQPNRIHLIGNHDISYHPNNKKMYMCAGYNYDKQIAIDQVLTLQDWDKLKLLHIEDDWHISHAGLTKQWFEHPVTGFTDIVERIDNLQSTLYDAYQPSIWEADETRGGRSKCGGLLWCDWTRLNVINGMNQIVGHTPSKWIDVKRYPIYNETRNINICVDCFPSEILEIDRKTYKIIKMGKPSQYSRK